MNILDEMSQLQQKRQKASEDAYRALLQRIVDDKPVPTDAQLLDSLISQFHYDNATVETHIAAIRRHRELIPIASRRNEVDDQMREAGKTLHQYGLDKIKAERDLNAEYDRLSSVRAGLGGQMQTCTAAQTELDFLARKYPYLIK